MFTADDLGKLILLSYWGPMLLLMAFALWAVWKWLPFGKAAKAVSALAVLVAVPALFILPLFQVVKADKKKEDAYQQRYQAAKAVFDRQCQNAGEKIYRTVDNVEGIMLLRVREKYLNKNGYDPMWDDAAALSGSYPTDGVEKYYINNFLQFSTGAEGGGGLAVEENLLPNSKYLPRYRYVDVLQSDGKSVIRYRGGWNVNRKPLAEEANPKQPARYAFTYENNVDPELRKLWIAGTTLKVLDLKTGELLAEKKVYAFETKFGGTANHTTPWSLAIKCPDDENLQISRFFVERVLKPKPDTKQANSSAKP